MPSCSFDSEQQQATVGFSQEQIHKWLSQNPAIQDCLEEAFGPQDADADDVSYTLAELVQRLFTNEWQNEDHVFLLVLCNLKKNAEVVAHELIESTNPAKAFLGDIKAMLPEYYINLPSFNFIIDQERIDFSYWQRRLVELTRFEVNISPEETFQALHEADWDKPGPNKYKLSIYCGFDAQRVDRDLRLGRGTSTLYLYIYSCQAGRLIKKETDARHLLGLSTSGVDYTQGLTVIINDITGKLPLTPTKDGIAWSEQASGEIHSRNLFAWAGAVAQFFWSHHKNSVAGNKGSKTDNKVKETMKNTIRSFALRDQEADDPVTVTENLEDAKLSNFRGIKWKRYESTYGTHWNIRRHATSSVSVTKGPDTLLSITKELIQRIKKGNAPKRKAIAIPSTTDDDDDEPIATYTTLDKSANSGSSDEGEETTDFSKARPWPEVDPKNLPKVTTGMLTYLRGLDENNLFEHPVVETLPQLKDAYLKTIEEPMDFKTIEEERMKVYKSTSELQQDLILIFQNCIRFNGASSPYGKISRRMFKTLDDAFHNVLLGKRSRRKRINYKDIVNQHTNLGPREKCSYKPPLRRKESTASTAQLQRQLHAERMKVKELQKQLAARDKRIQELEAKQSPQTDQQSRHQNPPPAKPDQTSSFQDRAGLLRNDGCQICGNDHDFDSMILCDGCDDEYHTYCLEPPLASVPRGDWYCDQCRATAMDVSATDDDDDDDGDDDDDDYDAKMPARPIKQEDSWEYWEC